MSRNAGDKKRRAVLREAAGQFLEAVAAVDDRMHSASLIERIAVCVHHLIGELSTAEQEYVQAVWVVRLASFPPSEDVAVGVENAHTERRAEELADLLVETLRGWRKAGRLR